MRLCPDLRSVKQTAQQLLTSQPQRVFIGCFSNTSAQQTTLQPQRWWAARKYTSPASFTGRPRRPWSASKASEKILTVQRKRVEV